jgi:hypothetical protein
MRGIDIFSKNSCTNLVIHTRLIHINLNKAQSLVLILTVSPVNENRFHVLFYAKAIVKPFMLTYWPFLFKISVENQISKAQHLRFQG